MSLRPTYPDALIWSRWECLVERSSTQPWTNSGATSRPWHSWSNACLKNAGRYLILIMGPR